MKTLYIVRHAKSSWGDPSLADHDRPLNQRGRRDAPDMAGRLRERDVKLDRLIVSSARRAQETSVFFADGLDVAAGQCETESQLYEASPEVWLRVIQGLDERWETVMMIGHNPTITALANGLGRVDIANVPTCGVLECRYRGELWGNFGDRPADVTVEFDYPKNLPC